MHNMQKIAFEHTTSIPVAKAWQLLTDIKNYPKYVKFVKQIRAPDSFKEGVYWSDITNIFWIDLEIKHKIIKIEKHKKFVYKIFLPFGGTMIEECELKSDKRGTCIYMKIEFTFMNYFLDFILGPILKKRLEEMLQGTFKKF